jgi:hypothetical protein
MRVVGYVRESADPARFRSAFEQTEELRRHAAEASHLVVAVCLDTRHPGHPTGRDGYLSLLGVVAAGAVDGVLVPGLGTFSADETVQEIAVWDLRRRGVQVLSTRAEDGPLLDDEASPDPGRDAIRRVLDRLAEPALPTEHAPADREVAPDGDVLIHIIAADDAEAPHTP